MLYGFEWKKYLYILGTCIELHNTVLFKQKSIIDWNLNFLKTKM